MESRVRGTPSASCGGLQTIAWWCWSDGKVIPSPHDPSLVQGWDPCRECLKRWTRRSVLYGPKMGIRVSTPFSEIAAHMVMFPPHWPGTSTVALWPMIFRPCLLRFMPASSMCNPPRVHTILTRSCSERVSNPGFWRGRWALWHTSVTHVDEAVRWFTCFQFHFILYPEDTKLVLWITCFFILAKIQLHQIQSWPNG